MKKRRGTRPTQKNVLFELMNDDGDDHDGENDDDGDDERFLGLLIVSFILNVFMNDLQAVQSDKVLVIFLFPHLKSLY